MFHKAIDLKFLEGTALAVHFRDGCIKRYGMSTLFDEFPQLRALGDRSLFTSRELVSAYGIVCNDEPDIETATVYEDGKTLGL